MRAFTPPDGIAGHSHVVLRIVLPPSAGEVRPFGRFFIQFVLIIIFAHLRGAIEYFCRLVF